MTRSLRPHQIRQCVVCRTRVEQEKLFRIHFSDGVFSVSELSGRGGRSAYVHRTVGCTSKGIDAMRLARALRVDSGVIKKVDVDALFAKLHSAVLEGFIKDL